MIWFNILIQIFNVKKLVTDIHCRLSTIALHHTTQATLSFVKKYWVGSRIKIIKKEKLKK